MPVYEYKCSKGHEYEKTESFSAPTEQKCVTCGAKAKRKISRPTVIFKGSGFYSTDNRGSSERRSDESPAPAATSTDNGHGHSHGDGGHSQDSAPAAPKIDASVD